MRGAVGTPPAVKLNLTPDASGGVRVNLEPNLCEVCGFAAHPPPIGKPDTDCALGPTCIAKFDTARCLGCHEPITAGLDEVACCGGNWMHAGCAVACEHRVHAERATEGKSAESAASMRAAANEAIVEMMWYMGPWRRGRVTPRPRPGSSDEPSKS